MGRSWLGWVAVDGEEGGDGGFDAGGNRGGVGCVMAEGSAELLVADDAAEELLGGDLEVIDHELADGDTSGKEGAKTGVGDRGTPFVEDLGQLGEPVVFAGGQAEQDGGLLAEGGLCRCVADGPQPLLDAERVELITRALPDCGLRQVGDDRLEQLLLRCKVPVQRGFGPAGCGDELVHAHAVKAVGGEQGESRVQVLLATIHSGELYRFV